MILKKNVKTLLAHLDNELAKRDTKREISIFGSGALILLGLVRDDRATVDIDMFDPELDTELQIAAADAGEKLGLDLSWLDGGSNIFARNFPKGFQDRSKVVFKGKALVVKVLGRKDLVATKMKGYCDRYYDTDLNDLHDLKPSKAELEYTKKWLLSLDNRYSEKQIDEAIANVLSKKKELSRERSR